MKKYILIAIVIVSIGALGLLKYMFRSSSDSVKSEKVDIETSVIDIIEAYEINESEANVIYLNKVIQVTGTISTIEENETGYSVYIQTKGSDSGILCGFNKSVFNANSVKVGDSITLKGLCTGYLFDVVLNKCAFIN